MMRIVLDTNVLISGTFWSGASFQVLRLVEKQKVHLVLSPEIIQEYQKILACPEILDKTSRLQQARAKATAYLLGHAALVYPTIRLNVVSDPDDNKFIETAIEGKADFVVTQDKHLLKIGSYKRIKILTPLDFLKAFYSNFT